MMSEGDDPNVPPMIRQGQLIEQISGMLPDRVTGDWSRLEYTNRRLSSFAEGRINLLFADGSTGYALPPRDALDLLRELREVMYRPGVGTWLSVKWILTRDATGAVSADARFNYDEEPDWSDPIHPGLYGLDLEDFPRDEEHIPEWMREKLREAQAGA